MYHTRHSFRHSLRRSPLAVKLLVYFFVFMPAAYGIVGNLLGFVEAIVEDSTLGLWLSWIFGGISVVYIYAGLLLLQGKKEGVRYFNGVNAATFLMGMLVSDTELISGSVFRLVLGNAIFLFYEDVFRTPANIRRPNSENNKESKKENESH